ncbi:uncharacterized protein LOC113273311 [Papaver somniferum]|uniref:uncharacterized protein LOC113273311 n=1 Tax=Papaver somniferum TaxID=3469 RepID=UPI000E6F95DE|nr:uncharacterized protein LOC113273311 [Papaver somniferum]
MESQAGRSIMVKNVFNTILVHQMSSFNLPEDTINKMNSLQLRFWWNKKEKRGIFLTSWLGNCRTIADGGSTFRDLKLFNQALLAKSAWRLCTVRNSLWGGSLQDKYFKTLNALHAPKKADSTSSWKSISYALGFIYKYSFCSVGNRTQILIWKDKWIFNAGDPPSPADSGINTGSYTFVDELIDQERKVWKQDIISQLFDQETAAKILFMRIPLNSEDKLIWTKTKRGNFTVKSAYHVLYNNKYHNGEDQSITASNNLRKKI